MIEKIRAFFSPKAIVKSGAAWYCDDCKLVFITKAASDKHSCEYRFQDSIVRMNDERKERI
jgi:hypothetical protein